MLQDGFRHIFDFMSASICDTSATKVSLVDMSFTSSLMMKASSAQPSTFNSKMWPHFTPLLSLSDVVLVVFLHNLVHSKVDTELVMVLVALADVDVVDVDVVDADEVDVDEEDEDEADVDEAGADEADAVWAQRVA